MPLPLIPIGIGVVLGGGALLAADSAGDGLARGVEETTKGAFRLALLAGAAWLVYENRNDIGRMLRKVI